jgi:DNA-directed RNA polymerase specialized sigma24 family protein
MGTTNTSEGSQTRLDGDSALFDRRFWACYRLQHFIACRILNDPEQAKRAVENCWHSASTCAPRFEYEGAFRSWLLRVLIDEALILLRQRQHTSGRDIACEEVSPAQDTISISGADAQS